MSEYVESGYVESDYFEGDSVFQEVACDLSQIDASLNEVNLQLDENSTDLKMILSNFATALSTVNLNYNSLSVRVDDMIGRLQTLKNNVDIVKPNVQAIKDFITLQSFQSLNGNGTEFKDGVQVTIFGRETVYTVERSYMSLYSDNGYTVHYDLVSLDGYKCSVPEALLTKYVEAV